MDPQIEQTIDYIRQQLAAGYDEAAIRGNLLQGGWPAAAVDQVFMQYHNSSVSAPGTMPAPTPQSEAAQMPLTSVNSVKKSKIPRLVWIIAAVIGVVIIVVLALLLNRGTSSKLINKASQPALIESAADTARTSDISQLAAGLSSYIANHSGNVPQKTAAGQSADTLLLCGSDCLPENEIPVSLSHYKNTPAAVSFRAYSSSLKVPDSETIYIVNKATCNSAKTALGVQTNASTAAILYALQTASTVKQQCSNL